MSRVAKANVTIPAGVDVSMTADSIKVKGKGGELSQALNALVSISNNEGKLSFAPVNDSRDADALAGTFRQLVNNMVKGVTEGFEKKLSLIGVGYKASVQGSKLNLAVGFSHPVNFEAPQGITITTPTPTEIVIKGADRQVVGQLAAEIRAVRPPEPYKGKGIRYVGEKVVIKETKKK
ncbi:MAG: 50S ribosomal protein L6 [Comamonas sp.]|jgi:large subunit ribosomal protein L6|nr:50S ribosomal protein L6 [Comamonas sp.]